MGIMDDRELVCILEANRIGRLTAEHDPERAKAIAQDYLQKIQAATEKGLEFLGRGEWQRANHYLQLDSLYCIVFARAVIENLERQEWPKELARRKRQSLNQARPWQV